MWPKRIQLDWARVLWAGAAALSLCFALKDVMPTVSALAENSGVAVTPTVSTATPAASVSDVVAKALAFKALLTTEQQAVLEKTYTTTLARRWSNLPCTDTCRNGIGLGTLNATQLAAAIEVIKAAMGTTANEGSAEFEQLRLADAYLATLAGSGGPGGLSYGSGLYYIAFLNTPTTTGAWMLQFGGHHYGANIAYNGGRVVGTTPLFEALEPTTFTSNGTTYSPLAEEHTAMTNMLAGLTTAQLATAKLSQTFSDVSLSPGESNGGSGTFPTTKVGVAVSTLTSEQKQLVMAAMRPWVTDLEDTVAANLLAIYERELDGTYIAWTGSGTAGNPSSFLNANTNYVRIDGPSVWIEFACQTGVLVRTQIHYHTVYRDRSRDYGKDLSLTTALDGGVTSTLTATSAATYAVGALSTESLGTLFGTNLAASAVSATTSPWPTTLGGVQVQVKDAGGAVLFAPLYYVSATQVSFLVPANAATGTATLTVLRDGATVSTTTTSIERVVPGLFTANASGTGVPAAIALRVKADGTQTQEAVFRLNSTTGQYEPATISLGAATDQVFLLLFGTGFRNRTSLDGVSFTLGDATATFTYAGAHPTLYGLDQANVLIPRSLAGKGAVSLTMRVDGKAANTVTVNVQ